MNSFKVGDVVCRRYLPGNWIWKVWTENGFGREARVVTGVTESGGIFVEGDDFHMWRGDFFELVDLSPPADLESYL